MDALFFPDLFVPVFKVIFSMSRLKRFLLVTAFGINICVITAYIRATSETVEETPAAIVDNEVGRTAKDQGQSKTVMTCLANPGGQWLAEYSECEYMPAKTCQKLDGEMDECASACRHDSGAEVCISQCVPVCKFDL